MTGSTGQIVTLQDAVRRAQMYSVQMQTVRENAEQAHEQTVQARAARLPTLTALNQFIYTEGNNTASGVFIANDGVHIYNEQAVVKEDLLAAVRGGQMRQARATEAAAKADEDIAKRGLVATVLTNFYTVATAQEKIANSEQSLQEATDFVSVAEKQEQAGIVSHMDVVKAQIEQEQRRRDLQSAKMAANNAKYSLAVLIFPNFELNFSVSNFSVSMDPGTLPAVSSFEQTKAAAIENNPGLRGAKAGVAEAKAAVSVARYGYLPSLTTDFYYGIDANQLAATGTDTLSTSQSQLPHTLLQSRQNLGYSADVTLNIPLWDWGATRSKVRAAESAAQLANVKASEAERQLQASLHSVYEQAQLEREQLASLDRSRKLAEENPKLTLLRYQAGEAVALEAVSAETGLADARNAYEDGLTQYYTALAQLETLTGSY
jgi:outer membrane protein TolC